MLGLCAGRTVYRCTLRQLCDKHSEVGAAVVGLVGLGRDWAGRLAGGCVARYHRQASPHACSLLLCAPSNTQHGTVPQVPFVAQYRKEACGELLALRSSDEPRGTSEDAAALDCPAGAIRVRGRVWRVDAWRERPLPPLLLLLPPPPGRRPPLLPEAAPRCVAPDARCRLPGPAPPRRHRTAASGGTTCCGRCRLWRSAGALCRCDGRLAVPGPAGFDCASHQGLPLSLKPNPTTQRRAALSLRRRA